MQRLVEKKINDYLEVLLSDAPAPGGGSVSALSGAQGVALCLMVANLTLGKEKYAADQALCRAAKEQGETLYRALTEAVDKDTEAFNLVATAFRMPKETEAEKAARRQAIADGTLVSTEVPFHTMELGYQGLQLTRTLVGHSNPNAASDLGVAALQLSACVRGAWLNVCINLPGIRDAGRAEAFRTEGQKLVEAAEAIAAEIYTEVEAAL